MNFLLRSALLLLPPMAIAHGAGCSVRGAGPGDLLGGGAVGGTSAGEGEPADGDPRSVQAGSDGFRRQIEVVGSCEMPEVPVTKLLLVPQGEFLMGCNTAVDGNCRTNE